MSARAQYDRRTDGVGPGGSKGTRGEGTGEGRGKTTRFGSGFVADISPTRGLSPSPTHHTHAHLVSLFSPGSLPSHLLTTHTLFLHSLAPISTRSKLAVAVVVVGSKVSQSIAAAARKGENEGERKRRRRRIPRVTSLFLALHSLLPPLLRRFDPSVFIWHLFFYTFVSFPSSLINCFRPPFLLFCVLLFSQP